MALKHSSPRSEVQPPKPKEKGKDGHDADTDEEFPPWRDVVYSLLDGDGYGDGVTQVLDERVGAGKFFV